MSKFKNQSDDLFEKLSKPPKRGVLFTDEEKKSIEVVLSMGLSINNCYGETLKEGGEKNYTIVDYCNTEHYYQTISSALTQFLK